ncbi:MAG: FixH family protein [Bacteroidetes bacterium]|nr:FixH family protein [Bacteroidota bacterium]
MKYLIIFVYTGFVILILSMVTLSSKQKVDLVSKDYYKQELDYQNKINAVENYNKLSEKIEYEISTEVIKIIAPTLFKDKKVTGKILFYCPNDAKKDKTILLNFSENNIVIISKKELAIGKYAMQFSLNDGATKYFTEYFINI